MEKKYLAHISEDGREQTVFEHLIGTGELCASFASAFGAEKQGCLTGLMHDIGKYSDAFQRRLCGGEKVDHSTAGALECTKPDIADIPAAFCIAGHHAGLPDGGGRGDIGGSTLLGRLNRAKTSGLPDYSHWQEEVSISGEGLPDFCSNRRDVLSLAFYTRMLYSCLVDADYLDTEAFMSGEPRASIQTDFERYCECLDKYIQPWWQATEELNRKRCEILRTCLDKSTIEPGLYTLTVPTGGGKTVSSLAFALHHAREHGMKRVIYVIPYTSIIEQNAEVFRKILGETAVLEHHSSADYEIGDELSKETLQKARATENWDAPIVVTTAVQFFESLYSSKSSKCRKLHNIANSVVVFDEAQMLPLPYLRPCVHAIAQLVANYRVTALLCTATQPALNPLITEFLPGRTVTELCPGKLYEDPVFRRVTYARDENALTDNEIAEMLMRHDRVLCIVNSRAAARDIFGLLGGNGNYHLSTMMCPAHRKQILDEIRERLKNGEACRVVSTSLIEAGVDVDFPVVYRERAGLDSILQAAGRCNREGKRRPEESICTVFSRCGKVPRLFSAQIAAADVAMDAYPGDISGKPAVRRYFEELLDLRGIAAQDVKGILSKLEKENFAFRSASEAFRLIDDAETHTVYIPYPEAESYLIRLRNGERSRELFRKLGIYGVSVYEGQYYELLKSGKLDVFDEQAAVLNDPGLYDGSTGLIAAKTQQEAIFI